MQLIIKLLEWIEKKSALLQGKGWGSISINHEVKLAQLLLRNKIAIAFDIGANIGDYSDQLVNNNNKCIIHMFEPSCINYNKLRIKFKSNNNIIINKLGISNKTITTKLYSDIHGSGLGSIYKRDLTHFNIQFSAEESIKLIKFKDYADLKKILYIDFVKIDVEGEELNVLKSMAEYVNKTKLIQFEFGGCNLDSKTRFIDFYNFFKELNFILYRISPLGLIKVTTYTENLEYYSTTNYLALNCKVYNNE